MTIQTLPVEERAGIAGRHIVTCSMPASEFHNALTAGNGTLLVSAMGNPFKETIILQREGLKVPQWTTPPSAPKIAAYLPMIRDLIKNGKYHDAAELADMAAAQNGCPSTLCYPPSHPALVLAISQPGETARQYLQTLNMRTSVISVRWEGEGGLYSRDIFCSRNNQSAILRIKAPTGRLKADIRGLFPDIECERVSWDSNDIPNGQKGNFACKPIAPRVTVTHTGAGIFLDGIYAYDRGGFAVAVRVMLPAAADKVRCDGTSIAISDGDEALIFIRCEINKGDSARLFSELEHIPADFDLLLNEHTNIHTPMFDRLSVELGGPPADYLLSTTELKHKQFMSEQIVPAYMEAMIDMGRFFLLNECGEFPPIYGHVNVNVNHQISGGNIGNLPEMMESFFHWIEWQLPNARENAQNILGTRGIFIACHPDEESGKLNHFNEYWPHHYWISSTGWCLNPFLEYYYCTGDEAFLRNRVLPLYKELALLYEDFLTEHDENGRLMFVPSYSPENFPSNIPVMAVTNATMDISVCREVLTVLLTLGKENNIGTTHDFEKWERMLNNLPEYLIGQYGELKEWASVNFEERYDHRHASHLYGAYPGDEFQPELDERLYKAAFIGNRMRAFGNESCHGVMHRAQAAARLKDAWLVQSLLRFFLESGYVNDNFTTAHNPYKKHMMPDGQGALPTVMLESLLYSRPGFIELLPALPGDSFRHGILKGMAMRTFAVLDEMFWDLDTKTIKLKLTSYRNQKITLCCRKGILNLIATAALACCRSGTDRFDITLSCSNPITVDVTL